MQQSSPPSDLHKAVPPGDLNGSGLLLRQAKETRSFFFLDGMAHTRDEGTQEFCINEFHGSSDDAGR